MFQPTKLNDAAQAVAGAEHHLDGSDDDYADVENVSDSEASEYEADERSILKSAEHDLIDEFERTEDRRNTNIMTNDMNDMALHEDEALARRLSLQGTDSQVDGFNFEIDMNEDPFCGLARNDNLYDDMWKEAESAIWRMPDSIRSRETSDPSSTTQKRVRFEATPARSSSMSGSDDANEAFPDLFTAADDPTVKQRIALGLDVDFNVRPNDLNDNESFYDFEDEDERLAFELDEASDSDEDLSSDDCT